MTKAEGALMVCNVFQAILFLIISREYSNQKKRTQYYFELWQDAVNLLDLCRRGKK